MPDQTAWVPFGWQGLSALVPEDWNLAAIGGDFQAGYVRLDDAEMPRLEIKWSASEVDTEKALDRYLAGLVKKARKRTTITTSKGLRIASRRRKPDKRVTGFEWESSGPAGHVFAQGCIWRCRTCGRTVISQVMASASSAVEQLARPVLESLRDHDVRGRHTWAVYGLAFSIPKEFVLQRQNLMAGYLQLTFSSGKQALRVERWGMASMLLSDKTLAEWVRERDKKRRDVSRQAEACVVRAHEALALVGYTRRPLQAVRRGARRVVGLQANQDFFGQVWHCPLSNRIYSVEGTGFQGAAQVEEVAGSVVCHL
jgi:hypothetical protein